MIYNVYLVAVLDIATSMLKKACFSEVIHILLLFSDVEVEVYNEGVLWDETMAPK